MASHALSALFDGAQAPKNQFAKTMECPRCGCFFERTGGGQKRCKPCSAVLARERCRVANNKGVVGSTKNCEVCGVSVEMTGSRQKFCEPCARESKLASKRISDAAARKTDGRVLIGSIVVCKGCSKDFMKTATSQEYCDVDCRISSRRKGKAPIPCLDCGIAFERRANVSKRCDGCAENRAKKRRKATEARNADSIRESRTRWAENNPEKVIESRRAVKQKPEYKERQNLLQRKRRQEDPAFAINARMRAAIGSCLRSKKAGRHWCDLVGYTSDELMSHLERQFTPGMSWENRSEWHIDHIVPLSSFVFSNTEDESFKAAWALTNLRPLWWRDNLSKSARRIYLI